MGLKKFDLQIWKITNLKKFKNNNNKIELYFENFAEDFIIDFLFIFRRVFNWIPLRSNPTSSPDHTRRPPLFLRSLLAVAAPASPPKCTPTLAPSSSAGCNQTGRALARIAGRRDGRRATREARRRAWWAGRPAPSRHPRGTVQKKRVKVQLMVRQ